MTHTWCNLHDGSCLDVFSGLVSWVLPLFGDEDVNALDGGYDGRALILRRPKMSVS